MCPSHGLQLFKNCSSTVLSIGCSPSGMDCSGRGPPVGHWSCQRTCCTVGFSPWATGPVRSLLQHGLSMGSQPPSGIHLLRREVPSTGYRWRSAPSWSSMDCRGTTCRTMVFHHELQRKTLCSGISSTSSPLLLHWPWCLQNCFFHIVSLLSLHCRFTTVFFLPLLKSVITEALPPSLTVLALASGGSVLEMAGTGFIRHGGSFS